MKFDQNIKKMINLTKQREQIHIKIEKKHQVNKKMIAICRLHYYKIKKRHKNISVKEINRYKE